MRNTKLMGLAGLATAAIAAPLTAADATAVLFQFDPAASSITVTENSRLCAPSSGCALSAQLLLPFNDLSIEEHTSQTFDFANFNVSAGFGGDSDARVEAVLAFTSPLSGEAGTGGTATYLRLGGFLTPGLVGGSLIWDNPVQQLLGDNGELFTADVECIVRYARRYVVRTHHAAYLIVNFHPQGGRRSLCETLAIFTRGTALSTPLTRQ